MTDERIVFVVRRYEQDGDETDLGFCDTYEEAKKQKQIIINNEMLKYGYLKNDYEVVGVSALYHE